MKKFKRFILIIFLFCSVINQAKASHLYGGELYYTYVSGETYKLTMVLYGDCGGSPTVFGELYTATPTIQLFNGSSLYQTFNLAVEPGAGEEVTPVCPGSIDSTSCNGGTVPGVRRFVYSTNVTLPFSSTAWRFRSTGELSALSSAGRSNSITNIVISGTGSLMSLEATLNNVIEHNSNPTYTTIPTPFFCINVAQEYNQGAVDPNTGDSLVYELVNGFEGITGSTVSYRPSFSGAFPLATATGAFSFSATSGQLTFTPNLAQKALVVGKVSEYRYGVLVGTSMREMTFIVLSTCSNSSPYGKVSSVSGGVAEGNTTVNICKDLPLLKFNINPVDADGNRIAVTVTGLPAGATLDITGSGTKAPTTAFSWNTSSVPTGKYYFFVTYQDDGCPLSSKQTVAYTINVFKPTASFTLVSPATCVRKAVFDITPTSGTSPWAIKVLSSSGALVHTLASTGSVIRDSLPPGNYTFDITDGTSCNGAIVYNIVQPIPPLIDSFATVKPTCNGTATGVIFIRGKGGIAPLEYSIDGGAYGSSGLFTSLLAGVHTLRIRDAYFCVKDTTINLKDIDPITLNSITDRPLCNPYNDGALSVSASGGVAPYLYAFGTSGTFGSITSWSALASDTYIIRVKDSNNCIKEFPVVVEDSIVIRAAITVRDANCFDGADGQFLLIPYIGRLPFEYSISGGAFGTTPTFSGLNAALYPVQIRDGNGCILDTFVTIAQPARLAMLFDFTPPKCNDSSSGIISVIGKGGIPSYDFAIDGGAFSGTTKYASLKAGLHKFTIKDAHNCTLDTTVLLSQPSELIIKATTTNPLCNGGVDGRVSLIASGGTPTYLYSYNSSVPSPVSEFGGLSAGTYVFIITDNNGCKKDTSLVLAQPSKIQFDSIKITHPTCEGYADGAVALQISGGTKPYQYSPDGLLFEGSNPIENLKENTYNVTVRDSNDCEASISLSLLGYPKIKLDSASVTPARCFGTVDGSINLNVSGGNAPLRYVFENSSDTLSEGFYKNLKAKIYTITVIDRTNCAKEFSVPVMEPEPLKIETELTQNDCTGQDNGSIKILLEGGTRPYNYKWLSINSTDSIVKGLAIGHYPVIVGDAFNCTDSASVEIFYDNCCKPGIPNAFSPNGDGKNDVFRILYQGGVVLKELIIYNRFGQQVFGTNNISQTWDGTFNGQPLDLGVYYYFIKMKCGNDLDHEVSFKGDITLIR